MKLSDEGGGLWGGCLSSSLAWDPQSPALSWEPQLGASLLPGPSGRHQAALGPRASQAPGGAEASVGMSGQTAVGALLPNFPASTWGGWAPLS